MSKQSVSQNKVSVYSIGSGIYCTQEGEQYTWHEVLAARKSLVVYKNGQRLSAKELDRSFKNLQARRRRSSRPSRRKGIRDASLLSRSSVLVQANQRGQATAELVGRVNDDKSKPTATVACELMTDTVLWYEVDNARFEPSKPVHRDEFASRYGLTNLVYQEPYFGKNYQLYQYYLR